MHGQECTADSCLEGECVFEPQVGAGCDDDGNACTEDRCDATGACGHPPKPNFTACPDEGNICTVDYCFAGACIHPPGEGGEACNDNDGNVCTTGQCQNGSCVPIPDNEGASCPDDGNICTDDVCVGGQCTPLCEPVCTGPCTTTGGASGWCDNCGCVPETCAMTLSSATGAPCETVDLILEADCNPDCGSSMSFSVDVQYPPGYEMVQPWLEVAAPQPISCNKGGQSVAVPVTIHGDAPPGDVPIVVTGVTTFGGECEATGTLSVNRVYPEVEILYKTFIACEVAGPTLWGDPTLYDFFRGDNRGFGYAFGAAVSRTFQKVAVTIDPANPTRIVTGPTQVLGITQGFDDHPDGSDVAPLAVPYCQGECSYGFVPGATAECTGTTPDPVGDGLLAVQVVPVSLSEFRALITNRARDQCEQFVPGIDVDLVLEFRQICDKGILKPMEFRASGSYDGYPWHELYLNGVIVFLHDPCITGEGPSSMAGSGEHNFDGTGQFPEVDPSQTGINLSVWQPVPGVP